MFKQAKAKPVELSLKQTDQCVLCGLCLPHCPTYKILRHEADSPRGRISLMQAFAKGQLAADTVLRTHLDRCLLCRACESVCPSKVPYGYLIDQYRALLVEQDRGIFRTQVGAFMLQRWLQRPAWRFHGAKFLAMAQHTGILSGIRRIVDSWAPRSFTARALERLPQSLSACRYLSKHTQSPLNEASHHQSLALFTGCMAETFERNQLHAATHVLEKLGYKLVIIPQQVCCGALSQHAGHKNLAVTLAKQNIHAFAKVGLPIVALNSGCRAQLTSIFDKNQDSTSHPLPQVKGFCEYFLQADTTQLGWVDTPLRIALHTPCSLRYPLKEVAYLTRLLDGLPGVEVLVLPHNQLCCGGAGMYMLTQAAMADALLEHKLAALMALQPDVLITANLGCSLHWQAGIRQAALDIKVWSPAELVYNRLLMNQH